MRTGVSGSVSTRDAPGASRGAPAGNASWRRPRPFSRPQWYPVVGAVAVAALLASVVMALLTLSGRAEDGRPQHGSRAAAPASRAIAGAGTGRPRTGPPRRAQTGTVRGGTVARAAPSRHMDPPPPSPSPPPPKSRWMMTARGTAARPGGSARPGEPRQHAHLVAPGGLGLAERLVGGTDQFGQCPPGPVQHRDAAGTGHQPRVLKALLIGNVFPDAPGPRPPRPAGPGVRRGATVEHLVDRRADTAVGGDDPAHHHD